ncbi:MAG: XdhC family protein [Pyrinomonadaceae bacterium]
MNKELELWQFILSKLAKNEPVMLLVVAESAGSSPGRQGFKMAIAAGEMCGSIGGGVMEIRLVEQARLKIQDSKFKIQDSRFKIQDSRFKIEAEIVEQVHQKNSPASSGMICSGRQTIIFYKLIPAHLETVENIIRALENRKSKILRISPREFTIHDLGCGEYGDLRFQDKGEAEFLYEEKLGYKNNLFIIGGGHCALALSELMSKMDFHISLFDDRAELNTLDKNKFAHRKTIIESYENIGEFIPEGTNVYVVVMTLGYKFDEIVIKKLFDKSFKYFGVLGSRAKMKTMLRKLEKEGFAKERLNRIRTPIGLPINSQTPEEIAVSIAAEIIAVKNSK